MGSGKGRHEIECSNVGAKQQQLFSHVEITVPVTYRHVSSPCLGRVWPEGPLRAELQPWLSDWIDFFTKFQSQFSRLNSTTHKLLQVYHYFSDPNYS